MGQNTSKKQTDQGNRWKCNIIYTIILRKIQNFKPTNKEQAEKKKTFETTNPTEKPEIRARTLNFIPDYSWPCIDEWIEDWNWGLFFGKKRRETRRGVVELRSKSLSPSLIGERSAKPGPRNHQL
jgi:hypothetical protein